MNIQHKFIRRDSLQPNTGIDDNAQRFGGAWLSTSGFGCKDGLKVWQTLDLITAYPMSVAGAERCDCIGCYSCGDCAVCQPNTGCPDCNSSLHWG